MSKVKKINGVEIDIKSFPSVVKFIEIVTKNEKLQKVMLGNLQPVFNKAASGDREDLLKLIDKGIILSGKNLEHYSFAPEVNGFKVSWEDEITRNNLLRLSDHVIDATNSKRAKVFKAFILNDADIFGMRMEGEYQDKNKCKDDLNKIVDELYGKVSDPVAATMLADIKRTQKYEEAYNEQVKNLYQEDTSITGKPTFN